MKKNLFKKIALTSAFTILFTSHAFAGTWTHTSEEGLVRNWLWYYVKDDGSYARKEWVNDNGNWYWLADDGAIPISGGISDDGYLFNDDGIYVPTNDGIHHFVDKNMYAQLQEGMSPEQVDSILGKPHELTGTLSSDFGSNHFDYVTYKWFAADPQSYVYLTYTNGTVSSFCSYWNTH